MKRVIAYTLSTCPWCRRAKQFFAHYNIPFEYVDYDLQPPEIQEEIEKRIMESGEEMSFPWVMIDDTVVVGWNPERYAELLELSREER